MGSGERNIRIYMRTHSCAFFAFASACDEFGVANICANNDYNPEAFVSGSESTTCAAVVSTLGSILGAYPTEWDSTTCALKDESSISASYYLMSVASSCCTSGVSACSSESTVPDMCANDDFDASGTLGGMSCSLAATL